MSTGYTHKNPNWKGTKQWLFTSQGVFSGKKLSAQGTIERRKGPLPLPPRTFPAPLWENLSKPGFYSVTIKPADDTQASRYI